MALVLDATVKGAAANSYATVAEVQSYVDGRGNAAAWTGATNPEREQAVVWATQRLEQETFNGYRTTTTQALKWPRSGVENEDGCVMSAEVIPVALKYALAEVALSLLAAPAQLEPSGLEGFNKIQVGPLAVEVRQPQPAGGLPAAAMRWLTNLWSGGAGTVALVRA